MSSTTTSARVGMKTAALVQSARTEADVEAIVSRLETELGEITWRPVGDRRNNAGTVEIASSAASALVERVTNAIDGQLELGAAAHSGPLPPTPAAAAHAWYGVPAEGVGAMDDKARRALAANIAVTLHESGDAARPTVRVRDHGIGQHPADVPITLLSLNESNKVGLPYLQGAYGQGASATYRFSRFTVIVTRRAPVALAADQEDFVGFTIVWQDPGDPAVDKLATYRYLVGPDGEIPVFAPPALRDPAWHGVDAVHVGYELPGYTGAYNQPKNGIWALFHAMLFEPVLPFLVGGDRAVDANAAGRGTTRVVIGNAARLNNPDGPRGRLEVAHASSVALDVGRALGGDYGRAVVNYWVLRRDAGSRSASDPSASYVGADAALTMTLSGQRQDVESRAFLRHRAGLPVLSRAFVGQIVVDGLTPLGRRQLFASTRERAVDGPVRAVIYDMVAQALHDDPELQRLEREERDRLLSESTEVVDEKVRERLRKHIETKLRDRTRRVREQVIGPTTCGGGGRSHRNTDDSGLPAVPTEMRFEKAKLIVRRGASTTVWVAINARNGFLPEQLDALSVHVDGAASGKVADVSKSKLLGGRSLWRLQADLDAPLGTFPLEAVLVTAQGVLRATCELEIAPTGPVRTRTRIKEEPEQGPEIRWIDPPQWDGLGWDERTVGEVQASATKTVILVNRGQRLLHRAVYRNRRLSEDAIKTRGARYLLPVACALFDQHRVAAAAEHAPNEEYVRAELERVAEAVLLTIDQDALDV